MGMCLFETVFKRHAYLGNKGKYADSEDIFFKHIYANDPMKFWEQIVKES